MKRNLITAAVFLLALVLSEFWGPAQAQRRPRYNNASCLTGTYRLNQARSDDAYRVAERASLNLGNDHDQVRDNLLRRLEAPEMLALEQRGQTVTLASTRAEQISFEADGRTRNETSPEGRAVSVRAWLSRNLLGVSTTGNRGADYSVTFEPIENCRSLRVTRRLSNDRLGQPVIARSIYEKTSDLAQTDLYRSNRDVSDRYDSRTNRDYPADRDYRTDRANRTDRDYRTDRNEGTERRTERGRGTFVVPDGTQLNTVLDTDLSTKGTQDGDRFTLTVQSPGVYDGAVIEGFVRDAKRSGRITGRAGIYFDFERIRLRDGRSGAFAGTVESVRTIDGSDVRVDDESGVREDDSQTKRTVTRSGIGAALGAIIGAVAGGGKGAAIGAAVGAGAGAGSVIVQGRDDLDLRRGTEITLRASAPR